MRQRLHIGWLWCGIVLMMLTACSSSDETGEKQPTVLTIYVYSPEHPMLIRSAVGEVNASAAEAQINKLQIWIFESGTERKVGYLETTETTILNTNQGATFQMIVDDDFAQNKPDVDVYVLANVTDDNCGCSLDEDSSCEDLKEAQLNESHFGLSPLVDAVPGDGLPMVGVLKNQPVIGEAPVLRIGTQNNIATVLLKRAVSKVRFVFANTTGSSPLTITGITLDAGMIPDSEYLIPQTKTLTYNTDAISFLSEDRVAEETDNPTIYIYDGQEAQDYENLIDGANLTTVGPFYLHESDKRLSGKISYKIGETQQPDGVFQMETAGEFSRNHTWIIYAYHLGGGFLEMNTLYLKNWTTKTTDHEVYNW